VKSVLGRFWSAIRALLTSRADGSDNFVSDVWPLGTETPVGKKNQNV
jgi:hypothetical protein